MNKHLTRRRHVREEDGEKDSRKSGEEGGKEGYEGGERSGEEGGKEGCCRQKDRREKGLLGSKGGKEENHQVVCSHPGPSSLGVCHSNRFKRRIVPIAGRPAGLLLIQNHPFLQG